MTTAQGPVCLSVYGRVAAWAEKLAVLFSISEPFLFLFVGDGEEEEEMKFYDSLAVVPC